MKCAVIVHIFYDFLISDINSALSHIKGVKKTIFVTLSESLASKKEEIAHKLQADHIELVLNVGYDIYPFIKIISQIDLSQYDYIIKLHTKRNLPQNYVYIRQRTSRIGGALWRQKLLHFVSSDENFQKTLNAFKTPIIGMVADQSLLLKEFLEYDRSRYPQIKKHLLRFGFNYVPDSLYVAGTCFMARSSLFTYLQHAFSEQDFETPDEEHTVGLAHDLERVLGFAIFSQGFIVTSFDGKDYQEEMKKEKWKNFWCLKVETKNHLVTRICGIPISYQRLNKL